MLLWDSKETRLLLIVSFALRVIFALRFSYLHPDEHLQGLQEIVHGLFGWAAQTPWEFTVETPLRSFVPLWLVYGLPAGFFSKDTDPVYVLYALRVVFAALTWVLEDMAVDRLVRSRNDRSRCLFFVSTSYVTLTWQAHTFSNSLETVLVLWFLVILVEAESLVKLSSQSPFNRQYDSILLGLIVVLGVFNRPTFLAFLLLPSLSLLKHFYRFPLSLVSFAISVTVACAGCIYLDTLLYGSHDEWVITPLNFIRYNLNNDNVATHGVHSRLTHLLVNIPQLLGPGLILLRPKWGSLPMQTTVSALSILSFSLHQEARFMLPLVPILCSQMDLDQFPELKLKKLLLTAWLAFNLMLGILMGVFHQGGVIPAQVKIREFGKTATVIWWKTYTPPLWLTGLQSNELQYADLGSYGQSRSEILDLVHTEFTGNASNKLIEIDLQGASEDTLKNTLSRITNNSRQYFLVAPLAKETTIADAVGVELKSKVAWKTFFHVDPTILDIQDMSSFKPGLGIWNLTF